MKKILQKILCEKYTIQTLNKNGNTKRLSNFLLWQLLILKYILRKIGQILWEDYNKILNKFKRTKRNLENLMNKVKKE